LKLFSKRDQICGEAIYVAHSLQLNNQGGVGGTASLALSFVTYCCITILRHNPLYHQIQFSLIS